MCDKNPAMATKDDIQMIVENIDTRIGYHFSNTALAIESLTHRSYFNETKKKNNHNERLEFLGDAVLDLVISETLMQRMPLAEEGTLTQLRASLVQEESLAQMAKTLDLCPLILLGKGEEKNNGREKPSILSDAVEAVVGAVYLDGGYESAKEVILMWFAGALNTVVKNGLMLDAKSALQEKLQALGGGSPTYETIGEFGPDHNKVFEVALKTDDKVLATGKGKSKKEAEKKAAQNALEKLS